MGKYEATDREIEALSLSLVSIPAENPYKDSVVAQEDYDENY